MPPNMQPEMPMGRGGAMPSNMPMGPGPVMPPNMQPEMPMGRGGAMPSNMPMGPGPVMPPNMPPEMPMNQGFMNSPCNMDQFPVAMAYVPWQRWQQVYPVDKAINRGTIFPDLDKPFSMGRCR
ncbi:spore coat associated protein CotJA [Hungatella hathewayi]|nr:spore coat associated protein CotJA [Hungatella hathewayi]MUB62187.1 spore coat associated protein CotJA [Hungatella hathewayi]RHB67912.1 spore coat associated protein CotJA [Hungatella hathewayi]